MRKTIASWLLFSMVVMTLGQGSAFASEGANPKVDPKSQQERLARLGEAPVNINHKTNWDKDNIFILVREACGPLQSKNRTTGELTWKHLCLPVGTALDVPRGSTFTLVKDDLKRDEWKNVGVLDLPAGEAVVTACGNGFKPTGKLIGKLDEGRICPECPEARTIEVPVAPAPVDLCPRLEGLQTSVPPGFKLDSGGNCAPDAFTNAVDNSRQRSFCFRGGWRSTLCVGLGLLAIGAATSGGGDDDCGSDCEGRIPHPEP